MIIDIVQLLNNSSLTLGKLLKLLDRNISYNLIKSCK